MTEEAVHHRDPILDPPRRRKGKGAFGLNNSTLLGIGVFIVGLHALQILPLVALGGLFGMNVDLPDFVDGWFWIIFCGGLLLGGSLVWLVGRKTGAKS